MLRVFKNLSRNINLTEILSLVLVLALSLYPWLELPKSTIRGLGFLYLTESFQRNFGINIVSIANFNWFTVGMGVVLVKLFGTNMSPYFWTELIFMAVINILCFYLVLIITKRLIVAFSATLMVAVNYFGGVDMLSGTMYAYFLERVPVMILLIPSLIFLHLFLGTSKRSYYFYSLTFFFLGIGIQHWGVLFTSPYLFYPFFWYFFEKKKRKSQLIIKSILIGLPFLLISSFFAHIQYRFTGNVGPSWTFTQFIFNPSSYHYPENMLKQLVYWSSYLPIFEIFTHGLPLYPPSPLYFYSTPVKSLFYTPYVIGAYLLAIPVIYFRLPKFRALLFTIIFSVAAIFFLNTYFGQYRIENQAGTNRYLYLPTFLLVIFWVLLLWALFWKKNGKLIIVGLVFVGIYYFLNTWLIKDNFKFQFDHNNIARLTWNRMVEKGSKLPINTLVIVPTQHTDPDMLVFLNEQHAKKKIFYIRDIDDWQSSQKDYKTVVKIDYDISCKCLTEKMIK